MIIFSLLTFSTGNLLIIPYRLIKFQVHWSRLFGYFGDTSSMQKFKGNYLKKNNRKAMNRNWSNQKENPALNSRKNNTYYLGAV